MTLNQMGKIFPRLLGVLSAMLLASPAAALDDIEFDLRTTLSAVQSERGVFQGDDVESSGVGISADSSVTFVEGETRLEISVDPTVFEFSDETRGTRKSLGIGIELSQRIGETLKLSVRSRRVSNIVTLESRSADQRSLRGEVEWEKGNDRLRLRGEYRMRDYDDAEQSEGEGPLVEVQYNRRLGPYHWLRLSARHDAIESDNERRSYERERVRAEYSLPVAKRLRLRPALEYRQWRYDSRIARGDMNDELRRDSLINPEIGIAYGKTRGFFLNGTAEYEFRKSNDERFGENAPRFTLDVGYRF
ncbi:hypothetical protein GRI38_12415 [Altererythrobacter aurantiacus]|uniref:Uncharacterized protein n=1 Tax=Parapontixanthobacter aurantiacus TaxID=1463599 RepID=A0A844ZIM3_9SPHN|nr:hypothetical protein [Parapontixanthobacter aurantiacus]MXO86830.1 hypothetical protein [Parapontixanthobacter aurantiacus]